MAFWALVSEFGPSLRLYPGELSGMTLHFRGTAQKHWSCLGGLCVFVHVEAEGPNKVPHSFRPVT